MADSTVTITGTLTRDPELRFTQGGRGVATIGVAVNYRFQRNNEWVEEVSFFNVTAWGSLGENAAASPTRSGPASAGPPRKSSAPSAATAAARAVKAKAARVAKAAKAATKVVAT